MVIFLNLGVIRTYKYSCLVGNPSYWVPWSCNIGILIGVVEIMSRLPKSKEPRITAL